MSTSVLEQPAIETPPDFLYEMVDGRYVEKAVTSYSAWVISALNGMLWDVITSQGLGWLLVEAAFSLEPNGRLSRRTDLAFISASRWPLDRPLPYRGELPIMPDLAIEVINPSTTVNELVRKRGEYFLHGVREVWIVIPSARVVEVWSSTGCRLVRHDQLLTSELFPGIPVDLSKILREIDAVEATEDSPARN